MDRSSSEDELLPIPEASNQGSGQATTTGIGTLSPEEGAGHYQRRNASHSQRETSHPSGGVGATGEAGWFHGSIQQISATNYSWLWRSSHVRLHREPPTPNPSTSSRGLAICIQKQPR
jgi:hypothetical protein